MKLLLDSRGNELPTSRMGFVPSQPVRRNTSEDRVVLSDAISNQHLDAPERKGED